MNRLSNYDFHLPPDRIATVPAPTRDAARLLVVDRTTNSLSHRGIRDLPELLKPADRLVLNDSRVIPARLHGRRESTGGKWEGLFLDCEDGVTWRMLSQSRGRLQIGERVSVPPRMLQGRGKSLELELVGRADDGVFLFRPLRSEGFLTLLSEYGEVPLPPYIPRETPDARDEERYQTVYSDRPGSVAAPTAGLHFTPELLARCESAGASVSRVTLHVGVGTFRPVSVENLDEHRMHSEWCEISEATAREVRETKERGGRVIAVGTTSVRTLETASRSGSVSEFQGATNLFIREPWTFQTVDAMLTNFHLPRSTLLILVCAFAGRELILRAYDEAIASGYRFYSYGDAMLIV